LNQVETLLRRRSLERFSNYPLGKGQVNTDRNHPFWTSQVREYGFDYRLRPIVSKDGENKEQFHIAIICCFLFAELPLTYPRVIQNIWPLIDFPSPKSLAESVIE